MVVKVRHFVNKFICKKSRFRRDRGRHGGDIGEIVFSLQDRQRRIRFNSDLGAWRRHTSRSSSRLLFDMSVSGTSGLRPPSALTSPRPETGSPRRQVSPRRQAALAPGTCARACGCSNAPRLAPARARSAPPARCTTSAPPRVKGPAAHVCLRLPSAVSLLPRPRGRRPTRRALLRPTPRTARRACTRA